MHISLALAPHLDSESLVGFEECLQIWRACFLRCSFMRLQLTAALLRMIYPNPMELPLLDSLAYLNMSNNAAVTSMLIQALRLTFFILYTRGSHDSIAISIPPNQLTDLIVIGESLHKIFTRFLTAQCGSLKSLTLMPRVVYWPEMQPITFPALEKASLSLGDQCCDFLLPKFIAPALRTLHVRTGRSSIAASLSPILLNMLATSGNQLQHLLIESCDVIEYEEELYAILMAVLSLVFLWVKGIHFPVTSMDKVLRALVRRDLVSGQFPVLLLERLFIDIETTNMEGIAGMSEVLDLRRRAEHCDETGMG